MEQVLLGFIRMPPQRFGLEQVRAVLVSEAHQVRMHGALDALEHRAHPHAVERIGPRERLTEADRIAVAAREAEPEEQPVPGLEAERREDLMAQRADGYGVDDDDAVVVKTNLTVAAPELDHVRQLEVMGQHRGTRRGQTRSRRGPDR